MRDSKKLLHMVCMDLRWKCFYLSAVVIFFLGGCSFYAAARTGAKGGTVFDLLAHCFQGVSPILNLDNMERVPVLWLIVFLGCHLSVLGNAEEITVYGQQRLLRCGSRTNWWLSKCVWNICAGLLYFGIGIAGLWLFAVFGGMGAAPAWPEHTVLVPICCALGWNLFQMYLALYLKTYLCIFVTVGMLLLSVYITTPFLLGNFMMTARHIYLQDGGTDLRWGYLIAFLLAVCAVAGGIRYWKHCDYLVKE